MDAKILKGVKLFGYFVAVIYAKHWFKTPVGAEAAANNLQLYKLLLAHEQISVFKDISDATLLALKRHLWYSSKELIPFALCFHQPQEHTKQNLASKLFRVYQKFSTTDISLQKPVFQSISEDTKIENLVGERSVIIFQRFNFAVEDVQFLLYSCTKWNTFKSFRKFKYLVSTLHVTNDLGERGIKIFEAYKNISIENLEQRQMILHYVEKSRHDRPDFKKVTLAGSSRK